MRCFFTPCAGLVKDVRGRLPWYVDDWTCAKDAKLRYALSGRAFRLQLHTCPRLEDSEPCRVLASFTFIFFASAIPALAFGQQLAQYTGKPPTLRASLRRPPASPLRCTAPLAPPPECARRLILPCPLPSTCVHPTSLPRRWPAHSGAGACGHGHHRHAAGAGRRPAAAHSGSGRTNRDYI